MTRKEASEKRQELTDQLMTNCGVFWALSTQQFEENKTPKKEGEKYVSIGHGGYLPKSNYPTLRAGLDEIKKIKGTIKKQVYDVADFQPDAEKVEAYQEKQEAKADRYSELSEKAKKESDQRYEASRKIVDMIPFGQPILVGHHSERGHRKAIENSHNNMRKSIEADEKAKYYAEKAKRAESSNVISSDDPAAVVKLIEKLQGLEKKQTFMKAVNKIAKSKKLTEFEKVEQIQALGVSEASAISVLAPDYGGRVGFPSYALTNNNANINSTKKRIEKLRKEQSDETSEKEIGGVRVVDSVENNRLQIFFDGKPEQEIRTELKRNGFRWSPRFGAWQSYRGDHQMRRAESILN